MPGPHSGRVEGDAMNPSRRIPILATICLFTAMPLFGQLRLGAAVCNNRMDRDWIMTPALEIAAVSRHFSLGADATIAAFTSKSDPAEYRTMNRLSIYPMVRLPFRSLFAAAGYGVSKTYVRIETGLGGERYAFSSTETLKGEFRAELGAVWPITRAAGAVLKAGAAVQDGEHQFYFVSIGLDWRTVPSAAPPQAVAESEPAAAVPPDDRPAGAGGIETVTLISSPDVVLSEMNTAIESALIESGRRVVSWDRIRTSVSEEMKQRVQPSVRFPASVEVLDSLSNEEIAFRGARAFPLDAVIELAMRYYYKSYGGMVQVESASLRMISPESGTVLWVTEYKLQDTSFIRCKQKLIQDLLAALRQIKPGLR
jgi:hypothetical protein